MLLHKAQFAKDAPDSLACTNSAAKTDAWAQGVRMAAPKTLSFRAVANCEVGRLLQQLGRLRAVSISNHDFDPGSRAEARSLSRLHLSSWDFRQRPAAADGMEHVAVTMPRLSRSSPKGARAPESETGLQIGWALLRK